MDEKKRFYLSLVIPGFFLFLAWFIKFTELGLEIKFTHLGIYPLHVKGLIGIFTSPLVHSDFKHLADNSIPLFFLSFGLFYFYRGIAYRIFTIAWLLSGFITWIIGRESYHIGASGMIYSLAAFLFLSGIFRKNRSLMSISLLITFLYGSMVWGLLPYDYRISWEGHLGGAISGIILALAFSNQGPSSDYPVYPEDDEPETDDAPTEYSPEEESDSSGFKSSSTDPFRFNQ